MTMLCISSEFKGTTFIEESKRQGCHVILLTKETRRSEAWPHSSIDESYFMPDLSRRQDVINAVSYLCRSRMIDCITPLDDFDVETAAALREHLRLPGIGDSAARFFRDKLAMRMQARAGGIAVPEFSGLFNYDRLREFMGRVPPPWVLKPRSSAGSMGIKKVESAEEVWRWLDTLGDEQSQYLLEQFVPGDVFHVDSIISEREIAFVTAHQYGRPPMSVAHGGGIFTTRTLPRDSADAQALFALNRQVIGALGMVRGVNHAEYIKAQADGRFYFLEIAARVGG
ncbi:MAG: ATP-grasp domain-containing protein, partial [Chloroflexi bacterium]|nr:ATP-grasp domain-containing protein [Chloroflexota bacterium]